MCITAKHAVGVGFQEICRWTNVELRSISSNKLDGVNGVSAKLKLLYGSS